MSVDTFVQDAIRTESRIEQVVINPEVFKNLTTAIIALGSILDQMKKHTFYKKPYDKEAITDHLWDAKDAIDEIMFRVTQSTSWPWPSPDKDQSVAVNPRYFHSVVGIATEAVELLQALDINKADLDKVNLLEEFGDIGWYLAIGIDEAEGNFDAVLDKVIAKLRARFPDKFNSDQAINRDLVKERAVLEGNTESPEEICSKGFDSYKENVDDLIAALK